MNDNKPGSALRAYRWLAEAFPHEFKLAYGTEIMQLGEDVVEDIASRHGAAGLFRLIADLAMRVPVGYWSEMRDMRYSVRALLKSPGIRAGLHNFHWTRHRTGDDRVCRRVANRISRFACGEQ
jgi:hypothetical protein